MHDGGKARYPAQKCEGMLSRFTTILGDAGINIDGMANKSKGDFAYALFDVDACVSDEVLEKLRAVDGVLRVRKVK